MSPSAMSAVSLIYAAGRHVEICRGGELLIDFAPGGSRNGLFC
jgi:hypothetical protein